MTALADLRCGLVLVVQASTVVVQEAGMERAGPCTLAVRIGITAEVLEQTEWCRSTTEVGGDRGGLGGDHTIATTLTSSGDWCLRSWTTVDTGCWSCLVSQCLLLLDQARRRRDTYIEESGLDPLKGCTQLLSLGLSNLHETLRRSNTIIHAGGNIEVVSSFMSLSSQVVSRVKNLRSSRTGKFVPVDLLVGRISLGFQEA